MIERSIDLHCHSCFSDGALTPEELIKKAESQGIRCLSLTDHDTVAGFALLNEAAKNTKITLVSGVELSVRWKKYDIHILGYGVTHTDDFNALIFKQNQSRITRAEQIGTSLEAIGVDNAYSRACQIAGHHRVGRPHFAQLLVNQGKARDIQAAFKQFLGRGKSAYIQTPWISIQEAVEGIHHAGGQAVIAHPLKYGLTRSKLHELIIEFKQFGGVGLEVVSGEMNVTEIVEVAAISVRFGLLASSGSDFHSNEFSRTDLGRQRQLPENCTPIWQEWNI